MKKERIVVLGGGESGLGAALLAHKQGYTVFLSDAGKIKKSTKAKLKKKEIPFEEEGHDEQRILEADYVVKSPGIPQNIAIINKIRAEGIPIISEIEWGSRFTKAKIVAITGTNGKTTTTLFTYHLFKKAGLNVGLGGNIGKSFSALLLKKPCDYYILEVSSFQLEDIEQFRPWISLLLNISPDHLDRYNYSMEAYAAAKFRITENQGPGDLFIFNADDERIAKELNQQKMAVELAPFSDYFYENGQLSLPATSQMLADELLLQEGEKFLFDELPLPGKHNAMNMAAAILAALRAGISPDAIRLAMRSFKNHPHRMQKVASINGITFINDSKATNVEAVKYALQSFDRPIVWIAGGIDKGNNYEDIAPLVSKNVKALVCLGANNQPLLKAFGDTMPYIQETNRMEEAVEKAYHLAEKGEVVLLSPACSSFDLFKNYEDRGKQFIEAVEKIIAPLQTPKKYLNL